MSPRGADRAVNHLFDVPTVSQLLADEQLGGSEGTGSGVCM